MLRPTKVISTKPLHYGRRLLSWLGVRDIEWNSRWPSITSATLAGLHGEVGRAQKYFEESHANFSELEDVMGQAGTLSGLVQVALDSGDDAGALSMLIVATELYSRIRYVAGLLDSLELFATIVERRGESATAARLWGARYTLGSEIGRETDHPLETGAHNEAIARVRSTLGDEAFEQAWERGAAMTLEEAVELALEAVPEPQAQ